MGEEVVADNTPAEVECSNIRSQVDVCKEGTEVQQLQLRDGKDGDDGDGGVTAWAAEHPWAPVDCHTW